MGDPGAHGTGTPSQISHLGYLQWLSALPRSLGTSSSLFIALHSCRLVGTELIRCPMRGRTADGVAPTSQTASKPNPNLLQTSSKPPPNLPQTSSKPAPNFLPTKLRRSSDEAPPNPPNLLDKMRYGVSPSVSGARRRPPGRARDTVLRHGLRGDHWHP